MPTITFKGKPYIGYRLDRSETRYLKIPVIKRGHCDMAAFRSHKKYGSYANSQLFPAMIARELEARGIARAVDINAPPAGVSVDDSGFLTVVAITIE